MNTFIANFYRLLISFVILCSFNLNVFAFGSDLVNIGFNDSDNTTRVSFSLSKAPKSFFMDRNNEKEIKITLFETYLSTKLVKNLDVILNDNVQWKQYSDKLIIIIKHKGISNLAKINTSENNTNIVLNIPKNSDHLANLDKNSIKPIPVQRPIPVSRSISDVREQLPQQVSTFRVNPNNKVAQSQIYPGVNYYKIKRNTGAGPLLINVLDIAPDNPYIEVMPALANEQIFGKKTVKTIVRQNNAIAGINAGFFKPPTGQPLGTVIIDDELISGPIFDRVTLGITRNNEYRIERIHLTGQLVHDNGHTLKLDNVNQPRINSNQYLLYSYRWGWRTPATNSMMKQVALVNGKITDISSQSLPIPRNGYVIVGPDSGLFSSFRIGDRVKLAVTTDPDWSDIKHAIGGGPFLVRNSDIYVDHYAQNFSIKNVPAPRTAVGVTRDKHLLLVTVDGRQKGVSIGVTFYQLAAIMMELGAVNAMNLDGGSSTQMCVKQNVVNSPTVSGGSNVSNGLIIIPKSPQSASIK